MCRVLEVSTSGYYAWRDRPISARARRDAQLRARIETIQQASRATYGMPRVHAELAADGVRVGRKRVARLMSQAGLEGVSRRRRVRTTRRGSDARAIWQRRPDSVIHHSDQGTQYTSIAFGKRCRQLRVRPSTGSARDCYDNALAESFFATLETELLWRERFKSQAEARMAVFEFIEGFYNPRRRHSALDNVSPIVYERRYSETRSSAVETAVSMQIASRSAQGGQRGHDPRYWSHRYDCRRVTVVGHLGLLDIFHRHPSVARIADARRHGPADANAGIRPGARCTSYLRRPARYRSDRAQRRLGVDVDRHGDCRASSAGFHDHVARGSRLFRRVAGPHHSGSSAPRPDGIGSRRLAWHRRFTRRALTDNMETLSPKASAFLDKVQAEVCKC